MLGISKRAVYYWIASGYLATIPAGKSQRVLMASIVEQQKISERIGAKRPHGNGRSSVMGRLGG